MTGPHIVGQGQNIFNVTFWQVAAGQIIVGIASGILGPLAAAGTAAVADTHFSVPWWTLLAGGITGGLTALCHAIVGQQLPGTGVASFLPVAAEFQTGGPKWQSRSK